MKIQQLLFSSSAALIFSACTTIGRGTPTVDLTASKLNQDTIQFATTSFSDYTQTNYSEIIVYEDDQCSAENCRVMWHVVVPDKGGPEEFVYGGIPTFGAQTIVPAQHLKPNTNYVIKVGAADKRFQHARGRLGFRLSESGSLEIAK